jgi:hypothetical protein
MATQRPDNQVPVTTNTWRENRGIVGNGVFYVVPSEVIEGPLELQLGHANIDVMYCWLWPRQTTDPSSPQRGRPTSTKPRLSWQHKNLVLGPKWGLTPRLTDWPSVVLWLWLWIWLTWSEIRSELGRVKRSEVSASACVRACVFLCGGEGQLVSECPLKWTSIEGEWSVVVRTLFSSKTRPHF